MWVNICATDGLPSMTLASRPPLGTARSRLTRIVLFRSQDSTRASSRSWFLGSDMFSRGEAIVVDIHLGFLNHFSCLFSAAHQLLQLFGVSSALHGDLQRGAVQLAPVFGC